MQRKQEKKEKDLFMLVHYKTIAKALTGMYNTYNCAEEGSPYSSHC